MIAVAQPHGVGIPGDSRPFPPWHVILSGLAARLIAASRNAEHEGHTRRASRLDAAAHAVVAILSLAGSRPLRVLPVEGDLLAVYLTAWDELTRDLLARPAAALDPMARAAIIALGAIVEDTARWIPDA